MNVTGAARAAGHAARSFARSFSANNPIASALAKGMTAQAILELVLKNFPKYKNKINNALSQGGSPDDIVQYLQRDFEGVSDTKKARGLAENYGNRPTDYQRSLSRELRTKRETNVAKAMGVAALGAAGAGIAGTQLGARAGAAIFPDEILAASKNPEMLTGNSPALLTNQMGQARPGAPPINPMGSPVAPNPMVSPLQSAPVPQAAINPAEALKNAQMVLEKTGHLKRVKNMLEAGTPVENVKLLIKSITPKNVLKELHSQGIDLDKAVDDYVSNFAPSAQDIPTEIPDQKRMVPGANEAPTGMPTPEMPMAENEKTRDQVPNFHGTPLPKSLNSGDRGSELQGTYQEIAPSNEGLEGQETEKKELKESGKDEEFWNPLRPAKPGQKILLPNGEIGTLLGKKERNDEVDINGKKIKIPKDAGIPFSDDEIKKQDEMLRAYEELTPEAQRSTKFLEFDPTIAGMVRVKYASEPGYVRIFFNVPKEMNEKVLSASTAPKTTGKAAHGEYDILRADSRGSPFDEIERNPDKYPSIKVKVGHDNYLTTSNAINAAHKRRKKSEKSQAPKAKTLRPRKK